MISAIESLATGNSRDSDLARSDQRYQPLVVVALALVTGIVIDHADWLVLAKLRDVSLWSAAFVGLVAWWCFWRGGHPAISAWFLLFTISLTGGAWHDLRWNAFSSHDIGRYATQKTEPTCVTAIVLAGPESVPPTPATPLRAIPGGERTRLQIDLTGIRDGTAWLPAGGRCQLLVDGHLLGVRPGDELQIYGQLRRPARPMNPGEFDFASHARAEHRLGAIASRSPDCVTITSAVRFGSPQAILGAIRERGKQLLQAYVGREQAPLAAAILLGMREDLPDEELLPFFLTGTIHVIVVSGLNVGILALGLMWLQRTELVSRRASLLAIIIVVLSYTLIAGAQPPVVRSAVLVVLLCMAAWTGRRGGAFNALAAAVIIVLAGNPAQLFRTGTQLSFLCVAVLIWVNELFGNPLRDESDPLDRLIAASRPWYSRASRNAILWTMWLFITAAVVWLATLPLVLQRFHLASPAAMVIAPAVWLLALVTMWAGFITLACGWLVPIAAMVAGKVCSWSLAGLAGIVDWAEGLPGGHFWAPGPATWWIVGFYLGLMAVMLWGRALVPPRWQLGVLCAWIAIGLTPPLVKHWFPEDDLRCSFIAMGQGTCVVVETPDGQTLLYDAGSLGSPEYATEIVAGYLWHRGIMHIDGIILSHADVDHYNAVPGLLKRFDVGAVYVSPAMFDWYGATGPMDAPEVLKQALTEAAVPIREIWSGDRLRLGEVTIDVIHPPRDGAIASDNANSITVTIEFAGRRLLLPGDLETPGLEEVIAELPIDCDLLMAPHHGSRRSDPPGFAAWSTPEWVVISGESDSDSEVQRAYRSAGAEVLNTGQLGAVQFCLNRSQIEATIWLDRREGLSR